MRKFNRREVWLTDLGMAAKVRPCLIVSIPATLDDRALVRLVPHTTAIRNSRFEVPLNIRLLKPGAFDVQNIVTVPHVKLIRKLGELTEQEMAKISDRLKFWLQLD